MAVYKVLQDIEAEDKLLLWMTPRQTIYAAITIISCVLAFVMAKVSILLVIPWLFPIIAFGFLAAPLGRDQPNDIWLAAQIRFMIKNRKRIWDQSGMVELVQITAPKKQERIYTNGLDQAEVQSRLKALANTIDSRGWAVKNVSVNMASNPFAAPTSDDRLVAFEEIPQEVPQTEVSASDDILDPMNNMIAQRFDSEIKKQQADHKDHMRTIVEQAQAPLQRAQSAQDDYYFLREQNIAATQNGMPLATFSAQVVDPHAQQAQTYLDDTTTPTETQTNDPDASALLDKIHKDQVAEKLAHSQHEKHLKTPEELAIEERARALASQQLRQKQQQEAVITEDHRRRELEARRRKAAETKQTAQKTAPAAIIKELSQDTGLNLASLSSIAKHKADNSLSDGVEISLH